MQVLFLYYKNIYIIFRTPFFPPVSEVCSVWCGLSVLNLICVLGAAAGDAGSLSFSATPAR